MAHPSSAVRPTTQSAQPQLPVNPWLNVPPAPAYVGQQETDTKAILSLVLGILAIFPLWLLAGIPAVILGHLSKSEIRRSLGRLKGDGMATAGLIMGYFSVAMLPLMLIFAAILIPNLLRARIAANEAGAAANLRSVNTAQVAYSVSYPRSGYALTLQVLGPGSPPVACGNSANVNESHACLLDATLACTSAVWCEKNGYRYNLRAICAEGICTDYVITATPLSPATGTRSFCSTSDAVVRWNREPLMEPLTSPEECRGWSAM